MLFVFIGKDKPGNLEQRLAVRPVHLEHLNALSETLVAVGAVLDGEDKPDGRRRQA
ncbi:MAG: hypothetical protein MO846_09995 [Candidatus Devosia symbiotica]|nr:hypothetical protein [Candidatus Devosia symbiotica]